MWSGRNSNCPGSRRLAQVASNLWSYLTLGQAFKKTRCPHGVGAASSRHHEAKGFSTRPSHSRPPRSACQLMNYRAEGKMLQLGSWRASKLALWHFDLEQADPFAKCMNCQFSHFLKTSVFLTLEFKEFAISEVYIFVLRYFYFPFLCGEKEWAQADSKASLMEETQSHAQAAHAPPIQEESLPGGAGRHVARKRKTA